MKRYSWDAKAEVLAVYEANGPAEAVRSYGVSKTTVQRWARESGLSTSAETKRQTEAALDSLAARRLRIRDKLAERAEEMLDRMGEAMTMYVGSGASPVPVEVDRPSAGVCKELATTAAILIDKLQLVAGDATSREDHRHKFDGMTDDELKQTVLSTAERITRDAAADS